MTEVKHPLLAKLGTPPERYNYAPVGTTGLIGRTEKAPAKWRIYWLFWIFGMVLTGFIVPELHAILNEQEGDTLSENIRLWLKPETPGGGAAWLSIVLTLGAVLVWLWGHIHQYWP